MSMCKAITLSDVGVNHTVGVCGEGGGFKTGQESGKQIVGLGRKKRGSSFLI